jgi:hypothetical protein
MPEQQASIFSVEFADVKPPGESCGLVQAKFTRADASELVQASMFNNVANTEIAERKLSRRILTPRRKESKAEEMGSESRMLCPVE